MTFISSNYVQYVRKLRINVFGVKPLAGDPGKITSAIRDSFENFKLNDRRSIMNKTVTRCYSQSKKYSPSVDIVLSFQYWYHRDEFSFDGTGGNYLIIKLIKSLIN